MLAEDIREIMSELGFRNFQDMVGQTQMLEVNKDVLHRKSKNLDLSPLLTPATELNPDSPLFNTRKQDHGLEKLIDNAIIKQAARALESQEKVMIEETVDNLDRTVGTMLSYEVSKRYGVEGLPHDTIHLKLDGHGGQSLGFTLAKGIFLDLQGDANDYCGKGLSGGKIAVYPAPHIVKDGFKAEENVVVGNVCLYGATSGKAFFCGKAGERFCVRNSGALAVVEGIGDHGAEYMTGGRLVCLGETGRNFAAGMSGGIAYIYDPQGNFSERCNLGLVDLFDLESAEEISELKGYIEEHVSHTGSAAGDRILVDWDAEVQNFVKVFPRDYARVLEERAAREREAA